MNGLCRLSFAGRAARRHGLLLIIVMVVMALLSLAAYTYAELMRAELRAVDIYGRGVQARALADSGLDMSIQFLSETEDAQREYGGWYDNPQRFQMVLVLDGESPEHRGRFSILAPLLDDDGYLAGTRFGLEDESTRLNLNILLQADQILENGGRELLMALPGMTEEVADAILDWLDADDEPREFGAEVDYYGTLAPPYRPKNGPLESIEELLLVRGVTPYLLFGADANRNGSIDASEVQHMAMAGAVDTGDGAMERGWSAYLTLYSAERNLNPDGEPRINLNSEDLEQLYADLEEKFGAEWATFIVAWRQSSGDYTGTNTPQKASGKQLDFERQGSRQLTTVLDLVGSNIQVTFKDEEEPTVLETPFPDSPVALAANLPKLLDYAAVNTEPVIPGRININQAPRVILQGIPGLEDELLDRIIGERDPTMTDDKPGRRHETWLLTEGLVDLAQMKQLLPFICARGAVYRAQVVGYYEEGGPSARIEGIIDASGLVPRLLFWRDLSHLGRGYPLELLGVAAP